MDALVEAAKVVELSDQEKDKEKEIKETKETELRRHISHLDQQLHYHKKVINQYQCSNENLRHSLRLKTTLNCNLNATIDRLKAKMDQMALTIRQNKPWERDQRTADLHARLHGTLEQLAWTQQELANNKVERQFIHSTYQCPLCQELCMLLCMKCGLLERLVPK